ncbi:MAG: T9SS type A sorting domain-containing protein [Bacteroidales bacterium]|jgi:hypothetical protein|nr:T9SS type A sorting domain-containing protein [Bacteroidales bacterium]
MKRLLFLTLFFALSATAFPQEIKKTLIAIDAYKYNEKGKEIEKHHYSVTNDVPSDPDKTFTIYNSNGTKKEVFILDAYDDTTEAQIYFYENKQITITSYEYYGTEAVPYIKVVYYGVEDSMGTEEPGATYLLNVGAYKCDSFHIFSWENEDWIKSIAGKYTYNVYKNPTKLILSEDMDGMSMDFQLTYEYDTKQNCIKMIMSIVMAGMPLSLMNAEQTFDASSKLIETYIYPNVHPLLAEYLGEDYEDMMTEQKMRYTYNENGKVKTVSSLELNKSNGQFVEHSRQEYVYRAENIDGEQQYLTDTIYTYDIEDPASIVSATALNITCYPNPASDFITLSGMDLLSDVYIYDLYGKQLLHKQLNTEAESLHIGFLPEGMYIVKIKNEKGVAVSKFVKQTH